MSTGTQQPSARLHFFTGGLFYFESNSCSFCDAYCRGHTGSRPERAIGSLWHRHPEGAWRTLPTATLSWLSNTLRMPSCSPISITWKSVDSGSGCCHNSLGMSRHPVSFSIVPQPHTINASLMPRSPAYHCGHLNWVIGIVVTMHAFQSAHLPI